MKHKSKNTVILKTSMREAFEAVTKFKDNEVTRKVYERLKSNSGKIFRKKMWAVIRA